MKILQIIGILLILSTAGISAQDFSNYKFTITTPGTNINTPNDDYAPFLSLDRKTLYFTSFDRSGSAGAADIYYSEQKSASWQSASNGGSDINTSGNDGALSIAGDGKTFVFSSDARSGYGDADLFIAELNNGKIINIRNLGDKVNSKYWESQPSISSDGKTIYFASNRPGGFGGTDIWMTKFESGKWSEPVNLGNIINSPGQERSPYITSDGMTLYFSSDGHPGFGKKDIFISFKDNGAWGEPVNLKNGINSEADDLFFSASSMDNTFYFASNRAGGQGGYDIYSGTPNVFGNGMFRLVVSVLDSNTRKPIPGIVTISDAQTGDKLVTLTTDAITKEYVQILPAGRTFKIESQVRDYQPRIENVPMTAANQTRKVEILYGPLVVVEFDLGKYEVPFFVTGYYRVNTPENLDGLYPLLDGKLKEAAYIERFAKGSDRYNQYKTWSQRVDGIFRTVVGTLIDDIFPRFNKQGLPNEMLEISVIGYADPTPVREGAKYVEDEAVSFDDASGKKVTVKKGDQMDNFVLSGLRAFNAGQELDNMLQQEAQKGHRDYSDLKSSARLAYKIISGGVSKDDSDYAAQRRIKIIVTRKEKP